MIVREPNYKFLTYFFLSWLHLCCIASDQKRCFVICIASILSFILKQKHMTPKDVEQNRTQNRVSEQFPHGHFSDGHIPDGHFQDGLFPYGHFPDGHFPDQTLPRRTLPRRTFPWPDTSLTDACPTRYFFLFLIRL